MSSILPLGHHVPSPEQVGNQSLSIAPHLTGSGLALVKDGGEPIASSEVQSYLRAIDHHLYLRAFPFLGGTWHWALCETWGPNDRRREWIREGTTPPDKDFDIVGWPPAELKILTADDAASYLASCIRSRATERPEWLKYLAKIDAYNARQTLRNQQPIVDYATELAEANAGSLFRDQGKTTARVFQSDDHQKSGTKRTKGTDAVIPKPQIGD